MSELNHSHVGKMFTVMTCSENSGSIGEIERIVSDTDGVEVFFKEGWSQPCPSPADHEIYPDDFEN